MKKLNLLPPPVVAVLLIGIAYFANKSFLGVHIVPATATGLAWIASGLALAAAAALAFFRLKTTVLPHGTPRQLVTIGAFLWTRNPMYLGLFTALIGLAFYEGTLPFWLVPPAFFMIINRFHIPREEAKLTDVFGHDYETYQHQVRRWL